MRGGKSNRTPNSKAVGGELGRLSQQVKTALINAGQSANEHGEVQDNHVDQLQSALQQLVGGRGFPTNKSPMGAVP